MSAEHSLTPTSRWRVITARVIEVILGAVLLAAGLIKAYEPVDFARQISEYQLITTPWLVQAVAWMMIVLECALGAALIAGWMRRVAVPAAAVLFLIFLGVVGWAWATGSTQDCGCFGSWVERTPAEAFVEDALLLAGAIAALILHRRNSTTLVLARASAVAVALILAVTLTVASSLSARQSGDPVERLQAQGGQARPFEGLIIEGLDRDIQKDLHLIALIDTGCDHCQQSVPDLNRLAERLDGTAQLSAICSNARFDIEVFEEEFGARFPIGSIPRADFMRVFDRGEPPRLLLLREGSILRIWDARVPSEEEVREQLAEPRP